MLRITKFSLFVGRCPRNQDEDLLAEFDDHDYNANYASFGKDLVGSIMFGKRINVTNYLTVQRQRQIAARHQQILKDYNRKFLGPLQRTVAKWCQNRGRKHGNITHRLQPNNE